MVFEIEKEILNGGKIIVPNIFEDERGFFMEAYREDQFKKMGIEERFVQDNHSGSIKGVIRGLHFQYEPALGKLIRVTSGEASLVAVDIRKDSPTLGKWHREILSDENKKQIWVPAGFAAGFEVLSDYAEVQYKYTAIYNPKGESVIIWNDPSINIEWFTKNPILSNRDKYAQTISEWLKKEESNYFRFLK